MNELQRKRLRENRVKIVSDLEPKGRVLDTLYEDGVLTENDLEQVSSANTRKERCHILLALLLTRGPSAYGSFQKALDVGNYDFLANQLNPERSETLYDQDSSTQRNIVRTEKCQQCCMFFEKLRSQRKDLNVLLNRIVTSHCCLLLDNIEPRDVIDQLFQDHVITADDIDRVVARVTRRDRCETLFEILLTTNVQSNGVAESLKLALLKKYAYIVENISNDFDDTQLLRKAPGTSQMPEGIREPKFSSDHQLLLKTRLVESPMQYSDGYVENSDDIATQKDHAIIRKNEKRERSARTLTELSFKDHDQNSATDLETSVKRAISIENVTEMLYNDDVTGAKHSIDGINCFDGAFVDTSLKHRTGISERSNSFDRKHIIGKETMKPFLKTRTVKRTEKEIRTEHGNLHNVRKQNKQTTVNSVQHLADSTAEVDADQTRDQNSSKRALVQKQITAIQSERPRRRLTVAFNYLSTLINQGDFTKFKEMSLKLENRFPSNYDLMCIIGYLKTSRDLFQTDFDSAKSNIDSTMALVPKTSNPRYFILEIFTAKTRMYITQKKLEKLQTTLDEAMMILETDPVGCTGRAAGWLYINDARNKTAQLSCLNFKNPNALKVYERLFENAKTSFQRSMTNFKRDGGKDGPFGFGYALCRLVILLLRCGDNGLTMNILIPSADDIKRGGQYLQHLEDSDIVISKILDMHFRLAKCDYQYRRGNCVRALEHAQIAYDIATEMRLLEFTEHAYNRVSFLKPKLSAYFVADELSEEETERILFEDSSDTDHFSQSE